MNNKDSGQEIETATSLKSIDGKEKISSSRSEQLQTKITEISSTSKEKKKSSLKPKKEGIKDDLDIKDTSERIFEPFKEKKEFKAVESKKEVEPKSRLEEPKSELKETSLHSKKKITLDPFLPQLESFCSKMKIKMENYEIIRKNAEIELILKVPSAVGMMTYYCKAKNKKRCDEKDLSAAYMEAQIKKLPLLFLYSQELNQKAQEMLETGAFENVIVRKIETDYF